MYLGPLSHCYNTGHFRPQTQQQRNIREAPKKSKGKSVKSQDNNLHTDHLESLPYDVRALTHSINITGAIS